MNVQPSVDEAMRAYGLRGFPYARRELDPVKAEEDLALVCPVDGWNEAHQVGEFLAARAAARRQALVVIVGGSGTGRTSLANFLIRKWADGRVAAQGVPFDRSKLVVAYGRMSDHADADQLWQWVLGLWPQIQASGFAPSAQTEKAFETLRPAKPAAMAASLQNTLMKLVNDLYSKHWALAGILEDVKEQGLLTLASKSFEYVDSLLVMTVQDTAGNLDWLSNVEAAFDRDASRVVRLGELDAAEAREIVLSRWRGSSNPDIPLPFEEKSVEKGFAGTRRPVARVLKLMEALLTGKVAQAGPDPWPDATQLRFTAEEVIRMIDYLDTYLFAGR